VITAATFVGDDGGLATPFGCADGGLKITIDSADFYICNGAVGATGATSTVPGPTGSTGAIGDTGPPGADGADGATGP